MATFPPSTSRTSYSSDEPQAGLLSNILAIVGFIILIVVVIWGLVHLAGISRTWFSSLFGGTSSIEVTAPESAVSGTPFTVSWSYDEPTEGTYALLYQCQGGLRLQTPGVVSGSMNGIPCGAAFTIANAEDELSITPLLNGSEALDVPVSIIFMPSATSTSSGEATEQAQGSATVRIEPVESATPTPTPTPVPTPVPTPIPAPIPTPIPTPTPSQAPRTPADLSVRIISVTTDGYGNGVATFDIANVGGSSSGTYYFTANLPTQTGYTYVSPAQGPLAPGSHVVSTLNFTQAAVGAFSVSITTPDSYSGNNYASQSVSPTYYNQFNYQYPYQAQYGSAYYPQYQNHQPYVQYSPYSPFYPYAY